MLWDSLCIEIHKVVPSVEETVLFPSNEQGTLVKNLLALDIRVYFCTINSFLMTIPHYPDYDSFVVVSEIRKCEFPNFVVFPNCSGSSGPQASPNEFKEELFHFCKKGSWDFDKDSSGKYSHMY